MHGLHPMMLFDLVCSRQEELLRDAAKRRSSPSRRRVAAKEGGRFRPASRLRQRVGFRLVEIGLRLTVERR